MISLRQPVIYENIFTFTAKRKQYVMALLLAGLSFVLLPEPDTLATSVPPTVLPAKLTSEPSNPVTTSLKWTVNVIGPALSDRLARLPGRW